MSCCAASRLAFGVSVTRSVGSAPNATAGSGASRTYRLSASAPRATADVRASCCKRACSRWSGSAPGVRRVHAVVEDLLHLAHARLRQRDLLTFPCQTAQDIL